MLHQPGTRHYTMLTVKILRSLLRPAAISLFIIASTAGIGIASTPDSGQLPDREQQRVNDVRHSYEIKVIDRLLEQFHYKEFHLNDALSENILDNLKVTRYSD